MYDFLLVRHCNYSSIFLVPFARYLTLNNIVTLKCGLEVTQVIETGAIQKLGCGFLFAFSINYGAILYRLRDIATYWSIIVKFLYPICI